MSADTTAQILDDLADEVETVIGFLNDLADESKPGYRMDQAITAEVIAAWLRASLNNAYGDIEVLNRNRAGATIQ